jgi:hypothetical protein
MEQRADTASASPWPAPLPAVLGVGLLFGAIAAQVEPFTQPTELLVGGASVLMVAVAVWAGWLARGPIGELPPRASSRAWLAGLAVWCVLIAAIGLFQLAQFQSNPRDTYPTLSSLASIAFVHWTVRALAIAAWVVLGCYLVGGRRR